MWDATTGEPLTPRLRHSGWVSRASFSSDGRRVLTASGDGTARIWELASDDRPIENLVLLAQVLSGHRIDKTGTGLEPLDAERLQRAWERLRSSSK